MKDLSHKCVLDGSTDNLNTIMEVILDDNKYKVAVCDACEDDASLWAIKKKIPKFLEELEARKAELKAKMEMFKELAEEMGFVLVKKEELDKLDSNSKPVGLESNLSNNSVVQMGGSQFKIQKNTRKSTADVGMSAEEAEAAIELAKRRSSHTQGHEGATHGEAAPYSKHIIPEKITVKTHEGEKTVPVPKASAKKMQTVKGRSGIPTAIPRSLHGIDGETTITIVDTGGNDTIQRRGKQLAQMREYGDQTYYSQSCRPCQGTGFHAKRECRTCGGTGIII